MKVLFVLVICICALQGRGQTLPALEYIKLEKAADFKQAEPFALQTANFVLGTAVSKDNADRAAAYKFLIKWMDGTPDYSFTFEELTSKITKDNTDLLGLYFASLVKYSIENKLTRPEAKRVKVESVRILLNYCSNSANNMKPSKQLKKLAEAEKKGELEKELFD